MAGLGGVVLPAPRNRVRISCLQARASKTVFTKKYFWIILAAVAIAGIFTTVKTPLTLTKAAAVEFTLLNGTRVTMGGLGGRPVLINFWATSCRPCLKEIPELVNLYAELHSRGLEIIGVAMPYDPPASVLEFSRRHAIPYPIALDIQGNITKAFGNVSLIPATFVISPDGNIAFSRTGLLDIAQVRELILRLLENKAAVA